VESDVGGISDDDVIATLWTHREEIANGDVSLDASLVEDVAGRLCRCLVQLDTV
jgi:hypothetical protein